MKMCIKTLTWRLCNYAIEILEGGYDIDRYIRKERK